MRQPFISSKSSSAGMAVISFDLASVLHCPRHTCSSLHQAWRMCTAPFPPFERALCCCRTVALRLMDLPSRCMATPFGREMLIPTQSMKHASKARLLRKEITRFRVSPREYHAHTAGIYAAIPVSLGQSPPPPPSLRSRLTRRRCLKKQSPSKGIVSCILWRGSSSFANESIKLRYCTGLTSMDFCTKVTTVYRFLMRLPWGLESQSPFAPFAPLSPTNSPTTIRLARCMAIHIHCLLPLLPTKDQASSFSHSNRCKPMSSEDATSAETYRSSGISR